MSFAGAHLMKPSDTEVSQSRRFRGAVGRHVAATLTDGSARIRFAQLGCVVTRYPLVHFQLAGLLGLGRQCRSLLGLRGGR